MFDMAGDDAVQFGLGEPDFQPPALAIEAFTRAMKDGRNKYTTTAGLPDLRKKIAEMWHHRIPNLDESRLRLLRALAQFLQKAANWACACELLQGAKALKLSA